MKVTIQFSFSALFHKFSSCINLKIEVSSISHSTLKCRHPLWFQMTQFLKCFAICPSLKDALQCEIASQVFKLQIASSLDMPHFDTSCTLI